MNSIPSLAQTTTKIKLVYVYDALCGWCYGFSEVIDKFHEKHLDELEIEVISGGMITGDRIGEIGKVAPYIRSAYKDVERASGIKFGDYFLNHTLKQGTALFNSIPPSIALSAFKLLQPKNSLAFANSLQHAIYYDGIEPENINEYAEIASKYGIDSTTFLKTMQDSATIQLTENDFKKSAGLGVTGFPTVFIEQNGKLEILTQGFVTLTEFEKNFKSLLK